MFPYLTRTHCQLVHVTGVGSFALRRIDLGNLGDRDGQGGKAVAAELQRLLGWTDAQRDRSLAQYLDEQAIDPG